MLAVTASLTAWAEISCPFPIPWTRSKMNPPISRVFIMFLETLSDQKVPLPTLTGGTTLIAFATERPRTHKEMLAISGVGQPKLERYGDAFLDVILSHDG
ncbi:HRDC domain-containing protein [Rhizobium sp. BK068]|uniref:HRDC domain-containing protein n=2 Tax=unclassified Rhizobium TaxID=2613769 RepID=UPI0032AECC7B